ncbi:MAG TPA: hypothetical protein VN030_03440 [Cellvibrio sp.]|nr:hypothetical protein [Cellvibrio sp.]
MYRESNLSPPDGEFLQILEAPEQVVLRREYNPLSNAEAAYHEGELRLACVLAVYVPVGKYDETFSRLESALKVHSLNMVTGEVYKDIYTDSGWRSWRRGLSVSSAAMPLVPVNPQFAAQIIERHFSIDVFDRMPSLPGPGSTLQIYIEYKGLKSRDIELEVVAEAS